MREVLIRVMSLASRPRGALVWWVILALAGCALTALPLLGMPGYELSAALALVHGLLGFPLAVFLARRAPPTTLRSAAVTLAASTLVLWGALVPPFLLATVTTLARTPCNPFATVGFFPLLPLPSALATSAAGLFLATVTRRWWTTALAWVGFILLSAAHTTWPILFGPQVFAYNHFGGYLPGPLYDEELHVPSSLLWFRLGTIALSVVLLAGAARARRLLLAALAVLLLIDFNGVALGFRMTDSALAEKLGGRRETDELVLFYPRGLADKDVDRFLGDVRFRYAQIAKFLGGPPDGKVRIWWYRTAAEKQALVGAEHTQFAKPWRHEVHVNGLGFPHPVIKHELAHAMAATWGSPPFGVAARWFGLYPHAGVIEGLAVAADDPVDELPLHAWAAAMKKKALLPDVRVLLEPAGFYSAPPSRAYTAAGSFMRWLGDTSGAAKLRALYAHGEFDTVYGKPLPALATEWEAFLDAVPLNAEAVNQAFGRFKRGSIFDRPCAREVARLSAEASDELNGRPQLALELFGRCRALQPEEPSHVLAETNALRKLGKNDDARAKLDELLQRLEHEPSPWGDAAMARAALALDLDDATTARPLLERVLEREISPAMDRTAHVRLASLELPPKARDAVKRYFQPGDDSVRLYLLRDALDVAPKDATLSYLLGRVLQQSGESQAALAHLEAALEAPLPDSIEREASRLAIEAAFGVRDCPKLEALAKRKDFGPAFTARAQDWIERCAFH